MEYLFVAVLSQTLIAIFLFKDDLVQKNTEKILWFLLINSACILILKFGFLIFEENVLFKSYSPSITMVSPPLLYVYIKSVLSGKIMPKNKQIPHYLPSILFTIYFIIVGCNIVFNKDYSWIMPYKKVYDICYFTIVVLYFSTCLYLIYKSKNNNLSWLKYPIILWLLSILILYSGKIGIIPKLITVFLVTNLLGFIIFLIIFLKKRYQDKLNEAIVLSEKTVKVNSPKYEKSTLKEDQKIEILKTLKEYMVTKKPYLKHDLSLTKLAEELKTSKHNITEVLNQNLNKKFFLFINEYRVEEAKKRMKTFDNENLNLIAHFSGFKSKTTFIKYFKEITGVTPSEYRKNIK
ncbi:helix-turn-helix domain-containing protein [Polaribacter sargassicola]|uniref:helix-turn-helix domain-containing protein n=1 Tax=Polaribacter sargassicola TaxID=2836891 RepID=UPI001F3C3210|nr:helix-turn-helix transcriptional regulator [Polaribacter sp. DS7-9]MCG1035038.1 helix-turn-helix transcriptional regulator [Polaribacter sp. DS7-9]